MLAIFDLDDTLVDRRGAIRRWATLLIERESLDDGVISVVLQADDDGRTPRDEFLEMVRRGLALEVSQSEFSEWYSSTYLSCYVEEPESVAALAAMRSAGWTIGVISNGVRERTLAKLERSRISSLINEVCVASEVRAPKPKGGIFVELARRCGSELKGWMFGDAPVEDIRGGSDAGLKTAWISRGRTWREEWSPMPDVVAYSLAEAVKEVLRVSR